MAEFSPLNLIFRILFSILGIVGNVILILSIIKKPFARLKTFEVFLLGLAAANLEAIFIVDIYDVVVKLSTSLMDKWTCQTLKFLTVFGEVASILFTVLISVFRYQKLRDAETRGNLPIFLDNIRSAWAMSGLCVTMAFILGVPTYLMNLDGHMKNITLSSICPPDFFLCHKDNCPLINRLYKYLFVLICNLLPLVIVTVSGCLIIKVLLGQRRRVMPTPGAQPSSKKRKRPRIHRSTVAILAAMGVFQVDWTLYLFFHLYFSPYDFTAWADMEFFITTAYTTISPYVYGIGNNLFSLKSLTR